MTGAVPWWSFTKTVLAAAALRLAERGMLTLDERLPAARFSLRQLLRHEAGLPDYADLPDYHVDVAAGRSPWPAGQLLARLDADRLRYEPGTDWAYSNVGYLKVRQLVEQVTGLTLQAALDHLVFQPCRLATARVASSAGDLDGVQMGHVREYDPGWVFHGLAVGTVADAARLLRALMTGGLLAPGTLAEMLAGRPLPQHRGTHSDPAYGLGLMLWADRLTRHPLGHMGEGPGSGIAVLFQNGRAAAVWTARPSSLDAEAQATRLLARSC